MALTRAPRPPRTIGAAAWLLLLLAAGLDYLWAPAALLVHRADFGIGIAIGIISLAGGLFGLFKGKADTQLSASFFTLRNSIVDLGKQLVSYIAKAGGIFSNIVGALTRFYKSFIAPLIGKLAGIVARVSRILNRILGPLIRAVKTFRRWLLKFYDKVLRPILDTIAAVRAVLQILGKLGVKAAQKLDDALAGLEDKIRGPYLALLGKTNEIIDWLNRIVTLDGLLQRVTLLNSLYNYRRDVVNQFYWSQFKPSTPAQIARDRTVAEAKTHAERATELRTFIVFGAGPLRARANEMAGTLRIRLKL